MLERTCCESIKPFDTGIAIIAASICLEVHLSSTLLYFLLWYDAHSSDKQTNREKKAIQLDVEGGNEGQHECNALKIREIHL
jgi:hypothetical protein